MLAAIALLLLLPASGQTHPLGNFSINRYTALRLAGDAIEIRYVVDLAEIPTFQVLQEAGITTDPADPRHAAYATRMAETLREGLTLVVNGERPSLDIVSHTMAFPPGAGGLPTMKIAVGYRATLAARGDLRIGYRDVNFVERAGWKEIIAVGSADVPITESSVPDRDRSRELSDYPAELLASPPQVTEAHVTAMRHVPTRHAAAPPLLQRRPVARAALPTPAASPSGSSSSPASPPEETVAVSVHASSTPRSAFTELAAVPALSAGLVLVAVVVAAGLGALHALEPGHGKSVVAAYLVGSRGTARHAVLLGLIVTASHTVGVYLLGAVTLYASRTVMPERLYPWLGALSGIIIALVGLTLFVKRVAGSQVGHHHHDLDPDDSDHDDHQGHAHHGHAHHDGHHHHEHHHVPAGGVSLRALFALGVTGGIVPCPGALVVLLSAISLGRLGFGLVLITAFSAGLGAVLVVLGLILVHARRALARFSGESALLTRWLPLASSVVVTVLGVAIAVQALIAGGILQVRLS